MQSAPLLTRLRAGRGGWQHKLILLATLFAFALQSLIVQTHIHFTATTELPSVAAAPSAQATSPGEDLALCAICQEFLHAGQYLTPAPVLALLATPTAVPLTFVHAFALARSPTSHSWHGRAPPLV